MPFASIVPTVEFPDATLFTNHFTLLTLAANVFDWPVVSVIAVGLTVTAAIAGREQTAAKHRVFIRMKYGSRIKLIEKGDLFRRSAALGTRRLKLNGDGEN